MCERERESFVQTADRLETMRVEITRREDQREFNGDSESGGIFEQYAYSGGIDV